MKKAAFFGAAAAALLMAGAAHAEGGYVGAAYTSADDGTESADGYGLELAVAGSNFEFDAAVADSDGGDTSTSIAGHLFARNDSHLFGGFLGYADAGAADAWTGGLEANKYFENWTLAGAVGYVSSDDADVDGYGLNAEARVFASDNFRLQGGFGWASVDAAGDSVDAMSYGLGGEYQFSGAPVSIALGYGHGEVDDLDIDVDSWSVGLRYNWGGTLRDRDRNGASQGGMAGFGSLVSMF